MTTAARIMGIVLIVAGTAHFISPRTFDAIVPSYLPGSARTYTYLSGLAEIAIGIALLLPATVSFANTPVRLIAAYAALALFIAVFPANIQMAMDWRNRPAPWPQIAYSRLPLQLGLFYWAYIVIKAFKR